MKGTIIFDLEGTLVDVGGELLSKVFITEKELKQLATGYKLSVVTGATRGQLEYVLNTTFLGLYFDMYNTVSKDECSEAKAGGKPFKLLLDKEFPTPVVIIGDSDGDRLGAKALGVAFVRVNTAQLMHGESFSLYLEQAIEHLS